MMVLGIDPGRDKIGWALASDSGDLLLSGICHVLDQELFLTALTLKPACWERELSPWLLEFKTPFSHQGELSLVAVGNGTKSQESVQLFKRLGIQVAVVNEKGTTLEALELYWDFHPPSWWQRCLPRVMRFPSRPLDDLAALIIARRGLEVFK